MLWFSNKRGYRYGNEKCIGFVPWSATIHYGSSLLRHIRYADLDGTRDLDLEPLEAGRYSEDSLEQPLEVLLRIHSEVCLEAHPENVDIVRSQQLLLLLPDVSQVLDLYREYGQPQ